MWIPFISRDKQQSTPSETVTAFAHSQKVIKTESDLIQSLQFLRPLSEEINLSDTLAIHICPVETSAKEFVILVSSHHRNSEELRETARILISRGYRLSFGANVYVVESETLIHSVARGHIDGQQHQRMRSILGNKTTASFYKSFEEIVTFGVINRASDIHLNIFTELPRSEVRFTIEGKYVSPERFRLPTATLSSIAGVAYQSAKGVKDAVFNPTIESQCRIYMDIPNHGSYMLRFASMACDTGPQITMRLMREGQEEVNLTLADRGYLPSQVAMFDRAMCSEGGAIVLSGVVDSGKSTTIYTLLGRIPSTRKVVTIEDPREKTHPGTHFHANTVSRDLVSDIDPFTPKRRTVKRTALHDLFIGEIRDNESGSLLQDAIEAGTNVYTTVHARNHMGIFARLISPTIGIDVDVVTTPGNIKLGVYQALLPCNCDGCKKEAKTLFNEENGEYWKDYFARINRLYGIPHENIFIRNMDGCNICRRDDLPELNGLWGRTVVAEMVEPDDYYLSCIKDSKLIELNRHLRTMPKAPYSDPNMDWKSAMECAIYKMSLGQIDPREIEPKFQTFVTVEMQRNQLCQPEKKANVHPIETQVKQVA